MNNTAKKPGQWQAYFSMTKYALIAQTRNPATFFFGFIFPIVFISIFGLIGNANQKLTLGIPTFSDSQNPVAQVLQKQQVFKIEKGEKDALEKKLRQGKIAGIVTTEPNHANMFAYEVYLTTSSANPAQTAAVKAFLEGVVDKTNLRLAGVQSPFITIANKEVAGREFRYIDFALPGQIGFSLLSTAIFSTVFGFVFLKKALVFKRMFATPTHPLTILLAQGSSRLIVALFQTILILVIGIVAFAFYLPNGFITFFELMALSAIGLIAFLGFGLFLAGLAKDENSAPPMVNLVTLPQFLLSGVFFSTDSLPAWIQPVANNLPLSYFNIAVRKIATEGEPIFATWPYLLGLICWGIVMYLLAARTFKWE